MTLSMYQASVPRFANILGNLSAILDKAQAHVCLLYTSPSPRDRQKSRMPSSA